MLRIIRVLNDVKCSTMKQGGVLDKVLVVRLQSLILVVTLMENSYLMISLFLVLLFMQPRGCYRC